jgi:uncharacterized protein (DUF2384 family)
MMLVDQVTAIVLTVGLTAEVRLIYNQAKEVQMRQPANGPQPHSAGSIRLAGPAVRTFESIADRWGLSGRERERVLGLSHATYYRARSSPATARLDGATLERISHVLGIYKALHELFPDARQADSWIDRPSLRLGGETARSRLTSGRFTDLVDLRRYVDAARGW